MLVLGLGGSAHDYSACTVEDGEIRFAVEEERIIRIKHSLGVGVPLARCKAADYCLEQLGCSHNQIDMVVGNDILNKVYYMKFADRIQLINHHLAHAASAFYPSAFDEAAILVVDGAGSSQPTSADSLETMSYYVAVDNSIKLLQRVSGHTLRSPIVHLSRSNSLGDFYLKVTVELGFDFLQEGKTMGLAAYGTENYVNSFYKYYTMDSNGVFLQSNDQKEEMVKFIRGELRRVENSSEAFNIKASIAYAAQHHLEQALIAACNYLYKITGSKNLCLAGGVALNSVANFKILQHTPFSNIFVQPAAGDAGTSIGSALYGYHTLMGMPRKVSERPFSPYLGKRYSEDTVERILREYKEKLNYYRPSNYYEETARLLADGKIIGWFHGRSEIGPRALGNRSILADPRDHKMKEIINSRIKHREFFRPFAPIVTQEAQTKYFTTDYPSYYMLLVPKVLNDRRLAIPAVTHVDGTARIQTVSEETNTALHALLTAFEHVTGTPVLLNTSFNDNGEPIVETPEDAIQCYLRQDIDYLAMEGFLVSKKNENEY